MHLDTETLFAQLHFTALPPPVIGASATIATTLTLSSIHFQVEKSHYLLSSRILNRRSRTVNQRGCGKGWGIKSLKIGVTGLQLKLVLKLINLYNG